MSQQGKKKWLTFALRWGIAVAGITYVLWNLHFRDHVSVLTPSLDLANVQVFGAPPEDAAEFHVWGQLPGDARPAEHVVPRDGVAARAELVLQLLQVVADGERAALRTADLTDHLFQRSLVPGALGFRQ